MQAVLRNPKLETISNEALRKYAPAIFVKEPHADVSARYGFIPTFQILEGMHDNGYEPVEVRNYHRRKSSALQHTKHMIRFRQAGALDVRKVGDVVPQIVLINSHDRSSRFELYGGLFRLACLNGLLVSEGAQVQPVVVRHTTNVVEDVVAISERIIKQHANVFKYIDLMRKTKLTERAQLGFAKAALAIRPDRPGIILPNALLAPRRSDDAGPDMWSVFNRVQENLTKGGIEGHTANGRRTVTTEIRSIDADLKLNAGMWSLAMEAISKASASSKATLKLLETV